MTTVNIEAKALAYFERELNGIKDDSLRAFFYNALAVAPQSFHDDEDLQEHVKTAYHILHGLLGQRDVQGAVRDALLGTTLIAYIMFNEFEDDMRSLYTVAARTYLENRDVNKDIQQGLWENIMRAVEASNGTKGASPMLDAKPGTAEFEVLQAFNVARLSYIKLDWGLIYNENENKEEN
jgi:hypothetical protein